MKETFLFATAVFLLIIPPPASGGDLEDLRANLEESLAALKRMDLDTFLSYYHDDMVFFSHAAPFPAEGKAAWRRALENYLADSERLSLQPVDPKFRVVGDVGMAWSQFIYARKPKDGPATFTACRFLITYKKEGGKWLVIAQHNSVLPTGSQ